MSGLVVYLFSRGLGVVSLQLIATAMVLRALELGAGAWDLGLMGLVGTLSSLLTSYPLGDWVDRHSRPKALLLSQTLLILLTLTLSLGIWKVSTVASLLVLAGSIAILRNFRSVSQFSVFGELLQNVSNARVWINLSTLTWQVSAVVAPLVAGLIFHRSGMRACFTAAFLGMGLNFICQLELARHLKTVGATVKGAGRELSGISLSIKETWRFLVNSDGLLTTMGLDFVVILLASTSAVLPFLHPGYSHPLQVAFLRAAAPAGVIAGTLIVLLVQKNLPWKKWFFVAIIGFSLAQLAISHSSSFGLTILLLFLAGTFDALSLSVREVILQLETPPEMKGRMASLNNFLVNASDELGEWESGFSSHFFGLRRSIRWGASLSLMISGAVATKLYSPRIDFDFKKKASSLTIEAKLSRT